MEISELQVLQNFLFVLHWGIVLAELLLEGIEEGSWNGRIEFVRPGYSFFEKAYVVYDGGALAGTRKQHFSELFVFGLDDGSIFYDLAAVLKNERKGSLPDYPSH